MSDMIRVVMRRGVRKNGYELSFELTPRDSVRLYEDVQTGKSWFSYQTPFGEPRLVNIARFDVIDFKPVEHREPLTPETSEHREPLTPETSEHRGPLDTAPRT